MAKLTRDSIWGFLAPITPLAPLLHVFSSRQVLARVMAKMWGDRLSRFAVIALAASSVISAVIARDPVVALLTSLLLFLYLLFVWYGVWGVQHPLAYLHALVLGGGFLGFVVVVSRLLVLNISIFGIPVLTEFHGWPGRGNVLGMANNGLAALMEPAVIGALALLLYSPKRRLLTALAGAFALAGIFITFSRGSILALAASAFLLAATQVHMVKRHWKPIALLVVIGIVLVFLVPNLADRIVSIASVEDNIQRFRIWTGTWHMIADHPLFGSGPGNFGQVYPNYQLADEWENAVSPHNLYLYVLSGWGFVGFAIFFGYLAAVTLRSSTRPAPKHRLIALAMSAPFWIHVLFDDILMMHVPIIMGCAASQALLANEHVELDEAPTSLGDRRGNGHDDTPEQLRSTAPD